MRGSPRGSAGAGAGAGEAWTAGVSDGVGETVAGVPEVSAVGLSGIGYPGLLASHESAVARRVPGNRTDGKRIVVSARAAISVRATSEVHDSARGTELWLIRRLS